MGRNLENVIINELAAKYKKRMIGEYVVTAKNKPVMNLYDRLGFSVLTDNGQHKLYELDAKNYTKKAFDYYRKITFENY
jgi:predicted enzyme involved in methoxymalonyl-ACP biosynthesis